MKIRRIDFSPDEWIGGTVQLSNAERGLYITACALIYSNGGPVCLDHLRSACQDHGNAFNRQLQRLLDLGKLMGNGREITNKRCENELENARIRHEKASENGVNGNKIKRLKNATRPGVADATINHQPSTINKRELTLSCPVSAVGQNADPAETMTKIWNEECGEFARAIRPNATRRSTLAKRWREDFGRDEVAWRAYCQRVAAAPHLRGENDRGWRADLDWATKPNNLSHIEEGRYDQRLANGRGNGSAGPDGPAPRPEELWGNDDGREVGVAC